MPLHDGTSFLLSRPTICNRTRKGRGAEKIGFPEPEYRRRVEESMFVMSRVMFMRRTLTR